MAKDPAVLFYIQDFLIGVSFLTPLQKGHYITLLCHQQQSETGSLTEENVRTLMGKDFQKQWPVIKSKFKQDQNGFFNERMRKEVDRRKQYSEKQRVKAVASWQSRGNAVASAPAKPIIGNAFLETETETGKGGTGEKPKYWESEKEQFLMHTEWMTNFCRSKNISSTQFDALAKEFICDLELKEDYKVVKEIKSHFTSWFNKNKIMLLQNIKAGKAGTSAREIEEKKNREKLGI